MYFAEFLRGEGLTGEVIDELDADGYLIVCRGIFPAALETIMIREKSAPPMLSNLFNGKEIRPQQTLPIRGCEVE